MALGSTVEGFDYQVGDHVYVARLKEINQPILRLPTPTDQDPKAFTDNKVSPKKTFQPHQLTVTEKLSEACWRRFNECWTHCQGLNKQLP